MERDYKKLYEEAFKRAKEDYDNVSTSNCERRRLETIFPELIESEDERIRKKIVEYIKIQQRVIKNEGHIQQANDIEKWLVWLEKHGECNPYSGTSFEYNGHIWGMCARDGGVDILCDSQFIKHIMNIEKQDDQNEQSFWEKCNRCKYFDGYDTCLHKKNFGTVTDEIKENCKNNGFFIEKRDEQKSTDKVEPKFKVGDWIINNDKRIAIPTQILEIEEYGYVTSIGYTSFDKVKTDYHLWTIQDAKDGDVLYCKNHSIEFIVMNKGVNENGNIDSYFRYNSKAGFDIDVSSVLSAYEDIISPATKEQRDLLFQKMKEAGYEWDAENKELTTF